MNKKVCDVFDKLPDLKMLFQKTQKCLPFYIAGYIIRKDVDSSDDLLLNNTIFITTKSTAILFKTMD